MSKKGYIIGAIVVVVIVLFILLSGGSNKSEVAVKSFTATLAAQNESGISGTATVTDMDGKAKVVVNLTGAPAEGEHPAHLHMGSCSTLGEPKFALTPIVNGTSETVLEVSVDEIEAGLPLALNVHKSATEEGVYVACGDLTLDSSNESETPVENEGETVPAGDETPADPNE